jgi:predicted MarR family transcription regulator
MNTQARGPHSDPERVLQRAIVLQLLREDRPREWARADLVAELEVEEHVVQAALQALRADGVVEEGGDGRARASRATLRLDELRLVAI